MSSASFGKRAASILSLSEIVTAPSCAQIPDTAKSNASDDYRTGPRVLVLEALQEGCVFGIPPYAGISVPFARACPTSLPKVTQRPWLIPGSRMG